ncbi:MAG: hypothetical protein ACE5HI_09230, partial [bacterium]
EKFVKNGLRIVPNPTRQFTHNQPIHIYFEIYNLKLDADGQSAFTIEYTLSRTDKQRGVKKLFGLFGGGRKSSISVRSERQGRSAFSPENIAVNASKLKKGDYTFAVIVTDKLTGGTVTKKNRLTLN